MVKGPNQSKLDQYVNPAEPTVLHQSSYNWWVAQNLLISTAEALEQKVPQIKDRFQGATAQQTGVAFQKSAVGLKGKAAEMAKGVEALTSAALALEAARAKSQSMDDGGSAPVKKQSAPGANSEEQVQHQKEYDSAVADYNADYNRREAESAAAVQAMEAALQKSSDTMKQIHGQPDIPPPNTGGSGGTGGGGPTSPARAPGSANPGGVSGGTPGGGTHTVGSTDGHPSGGGHIGGIGHPPTGGTDGTTTTPTTSGTTTGIATGIGTGTGTGGGIGGTTTVGTTPVGTDGSLGTAIGTGGAVGGGAVAGGLAAGGLKGLFGGGGGTTSGAAASVAPRGTAAAATRGIGATSRTGTAGAIGRSGSAAGTTGAGTSAGRAGAAGAGRTGAGSSAGRGAGARGGSSTGGRSAGKAGGRSAGSAAGSNGRRNDKEKRKKGDQFEDIESDWIDDEDIAPGVLD